MEYFSPACPMDGVTHIHDAAGAYVTLLTGDRSALLIDTGFGFGDLPGFIAGITGLPLTVVNTHGHNDHTGGNHQFPEVYISPRDMAVAETALSEEIKLRVLKIWADSLPPGFSRDRYMAAARPPLPLEDGKVFDLGGLTAEIIPMPGHTPGSVGVFVKERRLLITGDAAAPIVSLFLPEALGIRRHIETLKSVVPLEFDHMLSGHTDRLIPRRELDVYIECAEYAERGEDFSSTRYRDRIFPEFSGRLYSHRLKKDPSEHAMVIIRASK